MKKVVCKLVALTLFTLALNGAVWAQDLDHKVRAEIPFSFYAGDKLLPAGTYTFGYNIENHYLMIASKHDGGAALLVGFPADAGTNGPSVLIFRTDGEGVYALESLKATDFAVSFHADKTLARLAAKAPNSRTTVTATP
jgi:hypothetical protein